LPRATLSPYTTLFRSRPARGRVQRRLEPAPEAGLGLRTAVRAARAAAVPARGPARSAGLGAHRRRAGPPPARPHAVAPAPAGRRDRKSTRLNSSHVKI